MKYCTKCGAQLADDALFCSKCGAKVGEPTSSNDQVKKPEPVATQQPTAKPGRVKGKERKPLDEEKVKEFLPVPLIVICASLILWIIEGLAHPTGILGIMPLLIFILSSATYGGLALARAIKTFKKQIYFNAALSLVLAVLLFTCIIIDFIFLFS